MYLRAWMRLWLRATTSGILLAVVLLSWPAQAIATQQAVASPAPALGDNTRLSFNRLSVQDGLSFASVRSLLQNQRGFLWIGTSAGLNRYDGYTFKVFSAERDTPADLHATTIMALAEDTTGIIWIGSVDSGLAAYDPRNETFTRYRHDN